MTGSDTPPLLSRRALLAGAAASSTATAGCMSQIQDVFGSTDYSQLSLEIKTLPADSDPFGIRIANQLRWNLEAVGIDTRLTVVDVNDLSRQVLLNHDFDIYVGQFPYTRPPDPDVLYPLFRSTFNAEFGWQNPFGFTHLGCDDLLDSQRSAGGEQRKRTVDELQRLLARTQPIVPLVFPDLQTGVRTDSFEADSWDRSDPRRPQNLLRLTPTGEAQTLRLAVVDSLITSNRNPISASYSQESSLVDLLYDSLAVDDGDEYIPWLAREYRWTDGPTPEVSIRLRDGLRWHDGRRLSAYDVGFTYEFLRDTSLGSAVRPIPSERFRGRVSLVEEVRVENARELTLSFGDTTQAVARRALTVPILPSHIWRHRTRTDRPFNRTGQTTVALTTANAAPVGSGPIRFEDEDDNSVEFSRFENHFLWRSLDPAADDQGDDDQADDTDGSDNAANTTDTTNTTNTTVGNETEVDGEPTIETEADGETPTIEGAAGESVSDAEEFEPPPEAYAGPPPFETLIVQSVSSDNGAVELLTGGDVDLTVTNLGPETVGPIEADPDLELIEHRSNAFYHLGFNTRRQPLRNPNVRRLVAQLIDKSALVEDYFGGHGVPAASPLAETDWLADSLEWANGDPEVPFIGTDGEVDVERARRRFREIGYQYTTDNELISQIR